MEPIAYVTPLWHGVELTRAGALGIGTTLPPAVHVAAMAVFLAVGALIANREFHKRLVV